MKKQRNKKRHPGPWPRPKKPQTPKAASDKATAELQGLPTFAIVAAINNMIDVLRQRGQEIRDWDEKDKVIQKMSIIGGKVYTLAPSEKPTEAKNHGENGDQESGG